MNKTKSALSFVSFLILSVLTGCISTPETVFFNGEELGTVPVTHGCDELGLDTDCNGIMGSERKILIDDLKLFVSSGDSGHRVFMMPSNRVFPSKKEAASGAKAIEAFAINFGATVIEKKVMTGNGVLGGVLFQFDRDVYSAIKELTIED